MPLSSTANADDQRLVSLYVDGQKRIFATEQSTVQGVLGHSGVRLGQGDLVEPSLGTAVPTGFFNINVYRARPVLVEDGLRTYHITSAYQSPRLLAQAAGLNLYPEDRYTTEVITDFVGNSAIGVKVAVQRSVPLTVRVDGKLRSLRTQAETVGEALKGANIELGLKDTVSVPLDGPVVRGMRVEVSRVAEAEVAIATKLPRSVQKVTDPNMLKGEIKVQAEGSDGEKTTLYRIHYIDGHEVKRDVLKQVSLTAPVTRVEIIGTKVLFAGSVEYWRPLVVAAAEKWSLDPNTMLRIMACESKGNALVVSKFVINGEHPTGLFQYLPSTWRSSGGADGNILDGPTQIEITARKMATQGLAAWQCK